MRAVPNLFPLLPSRWALLFLIIANLPGDDTFILPLDYLGYTSVAEEHSWIIPAKTAIPPHLSLSTRTLGLHKLSYPRFAEDRPSPVEGVRGIWTISSITRIC